MVDLRKQVQSLNLKTEDDGMVSLRRVRVAEDRVRELHAQLLSKTQGDKYLLALSQIHLRLYPHLRFERFRGGQYERAVAKVAQ
jgi:hypothetical protein